MDNLIAESIVRENELLKAQNTELLRALESMVRNIGFGVEPSDIESTAIVNENMGVLRKHGIVFDPDYE